MKPKEEPKQDLPIVNGSYGCIIQTKKQESKQETLEEAAEKYVNKKGDIPTTELEDAIFKQGFIDGAKWQQEQCKKDLDAHLDVAETLWLQAVKENKKMYSEEYMLNFAWFLKENLGQYSCDRTAHFEGKYLEQFKKK